MVILMQFKKKEIKAVIESLEACEKRNVCEDCKFENFCYDDLSGKSLAMMVKQVVEAKKVNLDWGN